MGTWWVVGYVAFEGGSGVGVEGGMGFDGDGEISVSDSSDVDGRQERVLSWIKRDRILPTSWQE